MTISVLQFLLVALMATPVVLLLFLVITVTGSFGSPQLPQVGGETEILQGDGVSPVMVAAQSDTIRVDTMPRAMVEDLFRVRLNSVFQNTEGRPQEVFNTPADIVVDLPYACVASMEEMVKEVYTTVTKTNKQGTSRTTTSIDRDKTLSKASPQIDKIVKQLVKDSKWPAHFSFCLGSKNNHEPWMNSKIGHQGFYTSKEVLINPF